jgi:ATP-binding cassette, subfamily C (CFTR/MRP), member 1
MNMPGNVTACSIQVEDKFGPVVQGCLGDFDFTLLFEDSILSICPLLIALLLVPFRVLQLWKRSDRVRTGILHSFKLVRLSSIHVKRS